MPGCLVRSKADPRGADSTCLCSHIPGFCLGHPCRLSLPPFSPLCDFLDVHLVLSTLIRLLWSVLLMRWWNWMMCILGECFRLECFTNFYCNIHTVLQMWITCSFIWKSGLQRILRICPLRLFSISSELLPLGWGTSLGGAWGSFLQNAVRSVWEDLLRQDSQASFPRPEATGAQELWLILWSKI